MIEGWKMIVSVILCLFFAQRCSTYSGTAIRKVEYGEAKTSEDKGVESGKKLEGPVKEKTSELKTGEKENGKETPVAPKGRTYVRMNADSMTEDH